MQFTVRVSVLESLVSVLRLSGNSCKSCGDWIVAEAICHSLMNQASAMYGGRGLLQSLGSVGIDPAAA